MRHRHAHWIWAALVLVASTAPAWSEDGSPEVRPLPRAVTGAFEPDDRGERFAGLFSDDYARAIEQALAIPEFPEPAPLTVRKDGVPVQLLEYGSDTVIWTKRVTESSALVNSELVFAGYGIVAPEYDWDDYAGIDVTGKTVVLLVNDPGYATQDPELFNGNAMTYYGRWTYKYEEAARQGAAGALIVHQTAPAGYGWGTVSASWTGPQFDLSAEDQMLSSLMIVAL